MKSAFVGRDGRVTLIIGGSNLNADWIGNMRNGQVREEELALHDDVAEELKKKGKGSKGYEVGD